MSWSAIATALAARIQAVVDTGKVHTMVRYEDEGFEEQAFRDLFHDSTEADRVNTWQITRTNRNATRSPDDARVTKVQHVVTIRGNVTLLDEGTTPNTEQAFQAVVDAICDDLDEGDRTLGGAAITYSTPLAGTIGHAMFYNAILCHDVTITLTIEENKVSSVSPVAYSAFVPPGSGIEARIEEIGSGILSWFSARLAPLGLVSLAWHRHMRANPTYPANPLTGCPRAFLRLSRVAPVPGDTVGCTNVGLVMQLSLWLQMRQEPGEEHQRLIASAMNVVQTALIRAEWRFSTLSVADVYDLEAQPAESVLYDEMDHPLGDPSLRISVAETSLTLTGRIRG